MKVALVSAANAAYFDLLLGLLHSIRALPNAPALDVCILDVGLDAEQLNQLEPLVTHTVPAVWDCHFAGIERAPSWYKALVGRPHLPKYFPGYDLIIWLDADTWLCTADALHQLIGAAQHGYLAIVPELDRTYRHWFQPRAEDLQSHYEHYRLGWGDSIAQQYFSRTVINSGVFALRSDSTGWKVWADTFEQGLARATYPTVEQCSLNLAIYDGRIPAHFLPSTCNWVACQSLPLLDPATRQLYSPMIPHERISLCHLINVKRTALRLACTDGSIREVPLTFDAIRGRELPAPLTAQP